MVEVSKQDLNDLCLEALRYVLPRHTYAVSNTCEIIKKHKDNLTHTTRNVMLRNIRAELDFQAKCEKEGSSHYWECDQKVILDLFNTLREGL